MSKWMKRAIVVAAAVAGVAAGATGAVGAGTVYHHAAPQAVDGGDTSQV
jgi:hypothetical protein